MEEEEVVKVINCINALSDEDKKVLAFAVRTTEAGKEAFSAVNHGFGKNIQMIKLDSGEQSEESGEMEDPKNEEIEEIPPKGGIEENPPKGSEKK